jgi:glycerol-3-phosphate dehydrogenase
MGISGIGDLLVTQNGRNIRCLGVKIDFENMHQI